MSKKQIYSLIGAIVIILIVVVIVTRSSKHVVVRAGGSGEPSGYDNLNLTGGMRLGVTAGDVTLSPYGDGSIAATGVINTTSSISASSTIYAQAGILEGGVNSTTTPGTTMILKQSDFASVSFLSVFPTTTSVTLYFPASTSLTTFLPSAGDSDVFVVHNSTTTQPIFVGLASSTGVIVESASSTTNIMPGKGETVRIIRKVNTDFLVLVTPNI